MAGKIAINVGFALWLFWYAANLAWLGAFGSIYVVRTIEVLVFLLVILIAFMWITKIGFKFLVLAILIGHMLAFMVGFEFTWSSDYLDQVYSLTIISFWFLVPIAILYFLRFRSVSTSQNSER